MLAVCWADVLALSSSADFELIPVLEAVRRSAAAERPFVVVGCAATDVAGQQYWDVSGS